MRSAGKQLRRLAPMLAAALMLVSVPPVSADSDHDRARQALEAGEILPLKTVLERLARDTPGQDETFRRLKAERDALRRAIKSGTLWEESTRS